MIDYGYCQSEACWGDQYMTGPRVDQVMAGIKAVGGSRVRIGVQVGTVADLDRAVNSAVAHGLKPLLCILNNPAFGYTGNSTTAFAAECKAVALRYGPAGTGQVTEIELFNESNASPNPPNVTDGGTFAQYLKAGYAAIKAVHSSCVVIAGGTIPAPDVNIPFYGSSINPLKWYQQIYAANGGSSTGMFDALGFHWYFESFPTTTDYHWTFLTDVRQLMVDKGDTAKKMWVTEVGVPYPGAGITSTTNARDYLKVLIDAIVGFDYMGPFFIYQFANSYSDANNTPYGIVDYNFAPKPVIYPYAATIAGSGGPGTIPDTTPPATVTGVMVSVSDVTATTVPVTWNPSTDNVAVTGYRVYQDTGVRLADAPTTNTVLTGLTPGTPYGIYVTAVDAAGLESVPSATKSFTTAPPAGSQSFDSGQFSGSTVPTVFTQLGLGFTVSSGVAQANAPTVNGTYYTVAPFNTDKQSPDHSMRITLAATATAADRANMAVIRCSADGGTWIAAEPSGGGKADSLRIITYMGGKARIRAAANATPATGGQYLDFAAAGNLYTARILDTANQVLAELEWTDINSVFTGAVNRRTALGWHHKRVGGVNYPAPGITGWKASDQNAVTASSGAFDPWMLAVVDDVNWAELIATGSWESAL